MYLIKSFLLEKSEEALLGMCAAEGWKWCCWGKIFKSWSYARHLLLLWCKVLEQRQNWRFSTQVNSRTELHGQMLFILLRFLGICSHNLGEILIPWHITYMFTFIICSLLTSQFSSQIFSPSTHSRNPTVIVQYFRLCQLQYFF